MLISCIRIAFPVDRVQQIIAVSFRPRGWECCLKRRASNADCFLVPSVYPGAIFLSALIIRLYAVEIAHVVALSFVSLVAAILCVLGFNMSENGMLLSLFAVSGPLFFVSSLVGCVTLIYKVYFKRSGKDE